jgi:AcrR family transcriptional regulator
MDDRATTRSYPRPVSTPSAQSVRLSRDTVLRSALTLLDEEGHDGLTMRKLADRLGVVPMAVYRHVRNKDDLIDGVLDLATSMVPIPDASLPWRDGLARLAHAIRSTMLAHPGIVGPLVTRPALGVSGLVIAEYGLALMRNAGFELEDAERGPKTVLTYTIGFVALEEPRRRLGFAADGSSPDTLEVPYELLPVEMFPHTLEVRPRAAELVSDAQFAYGLERVLDGIATTHPAGKSRPSTRA